MFSHADRFQTYWDHSNRIAVFLILTPFAFGLFYEYEACACALLLLALLFYLIAMQKNIHIRCGVTTLTLSALLAGYLLTPLWAVDSGMALLGFFKLLPAALFWLLRMQLDAAQRERLFLTIPVSARQWH